MAETRIAWLPSRHVRGLDGFAQAVVTKLFDMWAGDIQGEIPDAIVSGRIPYEGGIATLTISLPVEKA